MLVFLATNFGPLSQLAEENGLNPFKYRFKSDRGYDALPKGTAGAKAQLTDIGFADVKHPHLKPP